MNTTGQKKGMFACSFVFEVKTKCIKYSMSYGPNLHMILWGSWFK